MMNNNDKYPFLLSEDIAKRIFGCTVLGKMLAKVWGFYYVASVLMSYCSDLLSDSL